MLSPDKLLYKTLTWGPLFVGIISLVIGLVLVRKDLDFEMVDGSWVRVETAKGQRDEITAASRAALPASMRTDYLRLTALSRIGVIQNARFFGKLTGNDGAILPQSALAIASAVPRNVIRAEALQLGARLSLTNHPSDKLEDQPHQRADRVHSRGFDRSEKPGTTENSPQLAMGESLLLGQEIASELGLHFLGRSRSIEAGLGGVSAHQGLTYNLARAHTQIGILGAEGLGQITGNRIDEALHSAWFPGNSGTRHRLTYVASKLGAYPLFAMAGFANSLDGARFLKLKRDMGQLGQVIAVRGAHDGEIGLARFGQLVTSFIAEEQKLQSLTEAETLGQVAGVKLAAAISPLGATGRLKGVPSSAHNCPQRFYSSMKWIKSERIAYIKDVIKPISAADKSLPGRWLFPLGRVKSAKVCQRYKYYHSGRRKCLKYSRARVVTGAAFLSKDEQSFFAAAGKYVRSRGRDPLVKPRSPSYWVVNRVSRDLKMYTSQPEHPAICTGVPRMIDYFEGNLKKVSAQVERIRQLSAQSENFIARRIDLLNQALLQSENDYGRADGEWSRIVLSERLETRGQPPLTIAIKLAERLFGYATARELVSDKGAMATFKNIRTLFKSKRRFFSSEGAAAFTGLMGILEASHYVMTMNDKYQDLNLYLFGSLTSLKTAYGTHCNCEIAAMPSLQ
ncbi:MAG: hypothetical protein DHS20C08_01580 [Rhodomicrobium sp.]|nr:MAG: hypothetical protein DHS20C08_01580 [Rhodomicrobium sp.]